MNLREVMAEVLAEMGGDPLAINDGGCCDFASAVVRRIEGAREEWGCDVAPELEWTGCHCYIVFEGRCYDAECFEGVARPHDLPFYQRGESVFGCTCGAEVPLDERDEHITKCDGVPRA